MQQSWEIPFPHITRHPWPSSRHPLPSNNSGRMLAHGKPSGIPTQGSLWLYFVRIFYLAYIIIIFLASLKSVTTKISEIKYEKMLSPARRQTRSIPLNAASNGQELSLQCLIFALGQSEHASSLRGARIDRIDRIDRAFPFGNAQLPCLHSGSPPPFTLDSGPPR